MIVVTAILIFFEWGETPSGQGNWSQPKYIALEVIVLGLLVFLAMAAYSWLSG